MDAKPLIFADRSDAGQQLAAALPQLDPSETVVLALPRGGVPVAAEICAAFHLPLDLIIVRKIGAPDWPELALGAVTDGDTPKTIVNETLARKYQLSRSDVEAMGRDLLPEIEHRRAAYLAGRPPLPINSKTIVVVDDGVATGATLRASLTALQDGKPGRVIVALPVGPSDMADRLGDLADEVICLSDLSHFGAVSGAYRAFPQVDDKTVRTTLERFPPPGHDGSSDTSEE